MTALAAELAALIERLIDERVEERVRSALARATLPDEYLTTGAAAKLASVAPGTLRRWIREGRLTGHKAGRVVRVRRAELEQLLRDGGRRDEEPSPEELARRAFGG